MPGEPHRATVLVVDDTPQNVKLLRLILKDADYDVLEAASGTEALQRLAGAEPVDAMILDVRMPGMSGYEVCERVRADGRYAALPVIMVTALSMPEERIKGIEAGATDFITKPFNKKELLARLAASLALTQGDAVGLLSRLGAALVLTAGDWKLVAASPAAVRMLGLSAEVLVGLDLLAYLEQADAAPPTQRPEAFDAPWAFRLAGPEGRVLEALHTPILAPGGGLQARAITLVEGE